MIHRILLTSDLHIGRSSTRVGDKAGSGQFRAADAWLRIVNLAIEQKVTLVCLGGDVADQENKFFEAIGPLKMGLNRLADAGIKTVAVSGNHDFDVLPKLAGELPDDCFKVIGKGGKWERYTHAVDEVPLLHVDGWSFPERYYAGDPLESYPNKTLESHDIPVLGIVHGDLGNPKSPYAPINKSQIESSVVSGWHLGHIHKSQLIKSESHPWVLYPGSPQALDPGETGDHGVWITEISKGGFSFPQFYPISTIIYDQLEIDVKNIDSIESVDSYFMQVISKRSRYLVESNVEHLRQINFRITITGETPLYDGIQKNIERLPDLEDQCEDVHIFIEAAKNKTQPSVDFASLLESNSAVGELARVINQIDEDKIETSTRKLIEMLYQKSTCVEQRLGISNVEHNSIKDGRILEIVRENAVALISELIRQQGI